MSLAIENPPHNLSIHVKSNDACYLRFAYHFLSSWNPTIFSIDVSIVQVEADAGFGVIIILNLIIIGCYSDIDIVAGRVDDLIGEMKLALIRQGLLAENIGP